MEKFAKRKVKIFDMGTYSRVFFCEDSGSKFFVGDYAIKDKDYITRDVKQWHEKMKVTNL